MKDNIILGSRESRLAVIQSELIMARIREAAPEVKIELMTMKTTGDVFLDRTLDKIGGKGLFLKELEQALLAERIDLAVHSLKDMPMEQPDGLPILAYSGREDPRDVLILPRGCDSLDRSAPIGCSSFRRQLQLQQLYPDVVVQPVRGNVLSRLQKLDDGMYGALVLAAAGIRRLGLEERISRYFTVEEILPAAGQGIMAVQGRAGADYPWLAAVNDQQAEYMALSERSFVRELDGGCSSPTAAFARISGGQICLTGLYYEGTGSEYLTGSRCGPVAAAEQLGRELAVELRDRFRRRN